MSEFLDSPDLGVIAQAGLDVKAVVEHPGWAVLENRMDRYVQSQTDSMLGTGHEDAGKYAFTCGRIRAIKDFRALVNETIVLGEKAETKRDYQENA